MSLLLALPLALLCLLLCLLLLPRPLPPPSPSPPPPPPPPPPPLLHITADPLLPSNTDCPRRPRSCYAQKHVDQFGRILSPSPVPSLHSPPKSSRRLSTPLRLPFTNRRRSSSASCTSTLSHRDGLTTRAASPSSPPPASKSPPQRTRFVSSFGRHTRSRTLSPPIKCPDDLSSSLSSPSPGRRTLISKVKSIFKSKSIPPEPPPIVRPKPILSSITSKLRRKPVARTQPYGPPWNAPMPVPEWSLSQHSFQKPSRTSPSPHTGRKSLDCQGPHPETTPMSLGQLSPRMFVNELDEKLSLLQQQRTQDSMPSPHE